MTDWAMLTEGDQGAACPVPASATLLRDKWDEHAKEWIAWVRSPLQLDSYERFHRKRFLDLVPEPVGVTLDIACGEGRVARDLQAYGHTVLGVDWSQSMCEAAASHPDRHPDKSAVLVGDAARLPIADASVGCVVAFMSLHDIDNLQAAIAEIARVLQDGKKLALAIVHPMYSGGKFDQSRESQKDFIINDSYFQAKLRVSRDSQGGLTMTFYREHRPLQTYVKVLLDAGFAIEQLYEVTEEDEGNARHRVPMFLDILATRQPRKDQPRPLPESKTASRHVIKAIGKSTGIGRGVKKGLARSAKAGILLTSAAVFGLVVVATAVFLTGH
jgi:SAM-dependent methyltransferase